MAGFVFSAAGTAVGGPIGGAVGGIIGSYIDQRFLKDALFPQEDVEGPRFGSVPLSASSEGAPIPLAWGDECASAGVVIFQSTIFTRIVEEDVPGKGGSDTTQRDQLRVDVAVCYADADPFSAGLPSDAVSVIWADGTKLYDAASNVSFTSTLLSVEREELFEDPAAPATPTAVRMRVRATSAGPDLQSFATGVDVTISGFSNGGNNGTFRVLSTAINGSLETSFVVANSACVAETAGASATVAQGKNKFKKANFDSITFYQGDYSQTADPTIELSVGSGLTHGFRGDAYFVIEALNLDTFGGRPPASWKVLFKTGTSVTVGDAVGGLILAAGRTASDYDVSTLTESLRGFVARQTNAASSFLAGVMKYYDVLDQESAGVVTFFPRVSATVVEVDEEELVAHEPGSNPARPAKLRDDPGAMVVPRRVEVRYIDPDSEYQPGSQPYARNGGLNSSTVSYRFDLVLTAQEAQCAARRFAWELEANKRNFSELRLPPSRANLLENDIIRAVLHGRTYDLKIETLDRSPNGILDFRGVQEIASTLTFQASECTVDDSFVLGQTVYEPPELDLYVMDIPPLRFEDATEIRTYFATCAVDPAASFIGAELYGIQATIVGASKFAPNKAIADIEATMGITTSKLADVGSTVGVFDRANSISVRVFNGTLSSSTEADVLNGSNRAVVGGEILGFVTATFVSTDEDGYRNYTLSTLLRGLRDTDDETGNHVANDRFISLNSPGVEWFSTFNPPFLLGKTRAFRSVPFGGTATGYASQDSVTFVDATIRPFSPTNMRGTRDGSNNLTVTGDRKTRAPRAAISGTPMPQLEPSLLFEVDVLASPGGAVLRTIPSSAVTLTATGFSVAYSAAEQTSDGLTPGDPVDLEAFQVSTVVGRSKPRPATV